MACIGYICVQWALLETTILHIAGYIEQMVPDEAYIVFGGLDIRPRLNMAIKLSQFHGYPTPLTKQLTQLRQSMKESDIGNRRNTAVHGAYADSDKPHSTRIMMVRYSGDKRHQDLSVLDMHKIGHEIETLAQQAQSIFENYGAARLPEKRHKQFNRQFPHGETSFWIKIKHLFLRR